ncbi:MAG: hypothetical protein ACTHOK_05640 [Nocardioidaceae bacterium]
MRDELLRQLEAHLRPVEEVLSPVDMGGARYSRHSFARSMLRRASAAGWTVTRERFDIDSQGRGVAIYRVDAEAHVFRFVAFSQKLTEAQRTDRVVAECWDVTGALVEGPVDESRLASMLEQVTRQEAGRADAGTLIWTRANRSERFFDYVVDRLAAGEQPEAEVLGSAAYVLRSTAFYSNGKFGLADFERFDEDHPFAVPYRAHMLTAWLLRELSYDLVEHCAAARNASAATLTDEWRRYLGLGNATGLGMVPYIINHPQVLDAWARSRELPLAAALTKVTHPGDEDVTTVLRLLDRATAYLDERSDLACDPYLSGPALARQLIDLRPLVEEFASTGTMAGSATDLPWRDLHAAAASVGTECRGLVASILTELTSDLDEAVEAGLRCDERPRHQPQMTCGQLRRLVSEHYAWVFDFDFADSAATHHFWFSSLNNEEPRRAVHARDGGEHVAHGVDIARSVRELDADLQQADPDATVAGFLLAHPRRRNAVLRVQTGSRLDYGEVRTNLLAADFLPLHLQRFQLAVYGMENYSPQSTDWLRVSLFSGAPRVSDLSDHTADDDWMFTLKPLERTPHGAAA